MGDAIRLKVAFEDTMLEESPTWTDVAATDNLVRALTIRRGRQDEFQRTGVGTATASLNDTQGIVDPTNVGGAYYGELDGKQAMIELRDPVTDEWATIFRGFLDDYDAEMHPAQVVTSVDIPMVDGMDYLAGYELAPGTGFTLTPGDTPGIGSEGDVVYEATVGTVDDRINQALDDAAWPLALREVFTGNVKLQRTVYAAGQSALEVIREAADAEFPNIANFYMAKDGEATFHGRLARFNPSDPTYHIATWKLGDGASLVGDADRVQIRELAWTRPRNMVVNAAFCTPKGLRETERPNMLRINTDSITAYGLHTWSAEDLIISESVITGQSAEDECFSYSDFMVANYSDPLTRVTKLTVYALDPDDPRAPAIWAFLCGVDISDVIELKTQHPGGGGFDESFFVEGLAYSIDPLQPEYANVKLSIDVTPMAYYSAVGILAG